MCTKTTPEKPMSNVAVDGGDVWSGQRISSDEVAERVNEAMSMSVQAPIIAQYYPGRFWLWQQWSSTVVRRTLPREVLFNVAFATFLCIVFRAPDLGSTWTLVADSRIAGVAKAWALSTTMASLMLSFFLSQSYALWRSVYSVTRRVQGRINDFGLLCATFAARDSSTGKYTVEADALLKTVARYVRLFHMLFYASVTTRYAALKTPQGLRALVSEGALTEDERSMLLESSSPHDAVIGWLSILCDTAGVCLCALECLYRCTGGVFRFVCVCVCVCVCV